MSNYTIQTPSVALAIPGAEWRPIITIREPTPPAPKPRRQPSYHYYIERAESTGRAVWKDHDKGHWRCLIKREDGFLIELFPLDSEVTANLIQLADIEIDND